MVNRINVMVLGLACLAWFALSPKAPVVSAQNTGLDKGAVLQLTTTLVNQSYCEGDQDLDGVLLAMWFNYTNNGDAPLILQKESNLVTYQTVSRSVEDAAAKLNETGSSITWVSGEGDGHCFQGGMPSNCFVALRPGETYRLAGTAQVFVVRDESQHISGAVGSGEHVLEVMVPTWSESTEMAIALQDRWRASGQLWIKPVTSAPMPFTIATRRNVVDCR